MGDRGTEGALLGRRPSSARYRSARGPRLPSDNRGAPDPWHRRARWRAAGHASAGPRRRRRGGRARPGTVVRGGHGVPRGAGLPEPRRSSSSTPTAPEAVKPRVAAVGAGRVRPAARRRPGLRRRRQRGPRGRRRRGLLPLLPRRRRARARRGARSSSRRRSARTRPWSGPSSSTGTTRGGSSRSGRAWTTPATACRSSSAASSTSRSTTPCATSSPCPGRARSCAPTCSPRSAASTRGSATSSTT